MKPNNFTRYSTDLAAKFRSSGRFDLLALYHLLQTSDFAREGINHSGSYLFADHMYQNQPSGRGWFGRLLDRLLLNLPATVAMRSRCARATEELERAFRNHIQRTDAPFRILTIPCGLPRDFRDFVELLSPAESQRIHYRGVDIDPVVVRAAEAFLKECHIGRKSFVEASAITPKGFAAANYDFISSTGLGEFLDDPDLAIFYANVRRALVPGGTFYTSAAARERRSEWLLRTFEFDTRYRDEPALRRVFETAGWREMAFSQHVTGLQTFVRARRP